MYCSLRKSFGSVGITTANFGVDWDGLGRSGDFCWACGLGRGACTVIVEFASWACWFDEARWVCWDLECIGDFGLGGLTLLFVTGGLGFWGEG